MLCYAMLCYDMLCSAMLCHAMLCHAMPCYDILCYIMLCDRGVLNFSEGCAELFGACVCVLNFSLGGAFFWPVSPHLHRSSAKTIKTCVCGRGRNILHNMYIHIYALFVASLLNLYRGYTDPRWQGTHQNPTHHQPSCFSNAHFPPHSG